jgi:multidrug resistance efflux pump
VVTCMIILYTAIVIVLFKLKLLKPRAFPISWTVVAGVLIIGVIVVGWTLCAPMSPRVVTTQYVIQLVPYVKGQVTKVAAKANQSVKKGDLLLEINPAPYQYALDGAAAQLMSAQEGVKQAQAGLASAKANVVKAKASVNQTLAAVTQARAKDDLAKTEEQIALNLQKTDAGAISVLRVTQAQQNRLAADATVKQAEASLGEAQAGEVSAVAAENQAVFTLKVAESKVPAAQAQLDDARFNLTQCRMLAPADGYVVAWTVQEGTMLVPMTTTAAGTFINTSETFVIASFPQNYLANVEAGNHVELILDPYPGRLFEARVAAVIEATGEGQYDPSKQIPLASQIGSQGLLAVKIQLTGDSPPHLPLGAGGVVAIYTDRGKPVHIISKVTIRMKKWLLYVVPS